MASPALILFDVDGTLVRDSAALHLVAIGEALAAFAHIEDPFAHLGGWGRVPQWVAGCTDRAIVERSLDAAGQELAESGYPSLWRLAARCYASRVAVGIGAGRVVEGAGQCLGELSAAGAMVGLATGNARELCLAKLGALGLVRGPNRGLGGRGSLIGGFGDAAHARTELLEAAVAQARAAGWCGDDLVVVGDTLADLSAAARLGVPFVGVADDAYQAEALGEGGAALVVGDLSGRAGDLVALARAG